MKQGPTRILVVGGVAAGASAATKARRTDESAEITIFERGPYVSFANCGLPYYVGGEIESVADLLLMSPDKFRERFNIRVELHTEAIRIDRENSLLEIRDLRNSQTRLVPYDRLILAPGGKPVLPPIPGIDQPGVFSLTTVPDARAIKRWMKDRPKGRAVVIGAGFIGLEAVEALLRRGLEVHLVEKVEQVLPKMDWEMAMPIQAHLKEKGAVLHLGAEVTRFVVTDGRLQGVQLASGELLPAEIAIVAIGVRPETGLAREAGLEIGASGGVAVDDGMRSSDPAIFACGDVAEVTNRVTGKKVRLPLAGPANKEGRVAGANAAGGDSRFPGVVGTSIVKVCDLAAAQTGLSEREARQEGYTPIISYTYPSHHAGYYPGALDMAIKLIADRPSGRVLGAQIVGPEGVDKRIDVLATAIFARMTVEDLEGLDLAYAPPYSSAKDPVILAGFVAANLWRGEVEAITPAELAAQLKSGKSLQLLDVRDPDEFEEGHIPDALWIPLNDLRGKLDGLTKEKPVVVYCGMGYRAYHAYKILSYHGYSVRNLSGGFNAWSQAYPEWMEKGAYRGEPQAAVRP